MGQRLKGEKRLQWNFPSTWVNNICPRIFIWGLRFEILRIFLMENFYFRCQRLDWLLLILFIFPDISTILLDILIRIRDPKKRLTILELKVCYFLIFGKFPPLGYWTTKIENTHSPGLQLPSLPVPPTLSFLLCNPTEANVPFSSYS